MRRLPLVLVLSIAAARELSGAEPPAWGLAVEALMAADAASYAPPDLKRQLVKHRDQLMAGVKTALEAEARPRDAAVHRATAARGARSIAQRIRGHEPFADIAYEVGGLVHELAAADPPHASGAELQRAARSASFLGYSAAPFAEPEAILSAPLPSASTRDAYDASLTRATRLLAWIWKASGGDASIVKKFPETKGGYGIRE